MPLSINYDAINCDKQLKELLYGDSLMSREILNQAANKDYRDYFIPSLSQEVLLADFIIILCSILNNYNLINQVFKQVFGDQAASITIDKVKIKEVYTEAIQSNHDGIMRFLEDSTPAALPCLGYHPQDHGFFIHKREQGLYINQACLDDVQRRFDFTF